MSDNENENNTYNINIVTNDNNNKKRKIEESDKPAETYIFIQNEELSNQNKQLIIDMKELQKEKEEIDEWLDKADRDKNHLKNFMKTLKSIKEVYVSIYISSDNFFKIQTDVINI